MSEKNRMEKFLNEVEKNHENPRRYKLKNTFVNMLQYKLERSQLSQLMSAVENGLYKRSFNELEILNIAYLKPYPVLMYTKNTMTTKPSDIDRKSCHQPNDAFCTEVVRRSGDNFRRCLQCLCCAAGCPGASLSADW